MLTKWHKLLSRADTDLTTISEIDLAFYNLAKETGIKNREFLFTNLVNREVTHYTEANFEKMGRYIYRKYLNHPDDVIKHYKKGLLILSKTKKLAKRWNKTIDKDNSFSNLSSALADFYPDYNIITNFYSVIIWAGLETWQSDFDRMLDELIKKSHQEKDREKITASVYRPWKETANLQIRKKIASCNNLQKLVDDYRFLDSFSLIWSKPVKLSWFRALKKNNKLQTASFIALNKVISIIKPNSKQQKSLELAPYLVFLKDWRDELRREQVYYWSFLFTAIAKKFKIKKDDLGYLTLSEIKEALLKNTVDLDLIKLRKSNCIIAVANNKVPVVFSKNISKKYTRIMLQASSNLNSQEISGLIAYRGAVKGSVRIIKNISDIKNFRAGEVLVANTTHPDYLPAMQMAIAFVTNEGGIISHAAIVARETKKPCIVGTKNATKILKDGDMVEVDANKGIVKIIK